MELVERADFFEFLQRQLEKVSEGEGHCIFVSGEAGIGKTALVKAFCRKQKGSCVIYQGACDALFTPRPLAPLYDVTLQMADDIWPTTSTIEGRSSLFAKFFRALSQRSETVLIVFEDIHWADEATLDFIKFFARRISQLQCLFILTYRDDEIFSLHPLRNVLGQIPPDSFSRLSMTPLSRNAVAKMAAEKGYSGEDVFTISGGNPFYVNEILASYSPGVPDNIKDAILSVYNRQEEGTRNVWQILSVIPEGLEIKRFARIKAEWDAAIDHCFALQIIVIKNDRIIFKHELYRRTIENSLSPLSRISINKKILDLFLNSFEEEGEIERIVHYAKNANERAFVVKYAPVAARQAASVGAHIEASKLFLTAIEYAESTTTEPLVTLYEEYAYECYLLNQITEAIGYQSKALKAWQARNDVGHLADCFCFLSRLYWLDGQTEEAEKFARQSIEILVDEPASKVKAMAFSNMSQLKMLSEEIFPCIQWGNKAIAVAREINNDEILCKALNYVGASQCKVLESAESGKTNLMESLRLALRNGFDKQAASAYLDIVSHYVGHKEYELAEKFLQEGINFCEERDLDSSNNHLLALKSRLLLEKGDWDEADAIAQHLLENLEQPANVKIRCLVIASTIKIRRGKTEPLTELEDAKILAFKTGAHVQILPVIIAFLEYEWLTTTTLISPQELQVCLDLIRKVDNIFLNSAFYFWLCHARSQPLPLGELYQPYQLLEAGEIRKAAAFWASKGCPFEQALMLFKGDENDKRNALLIYQQLEASALCEKAKSEMRAGGIKNIPRGLRESTRNNPAQLTNRELDVLQLLQDGAQNKEIAGLLYISPKTADHHISSILSKLDVNTRSKAVTKAVRLGILK